MGIAKRQAGFYGKKKTSDRLRGSLSPAKSDLRGSEFERLKPLVKKRDGYTCRKCGNSNHPDHPTNIVLTVDHIIPVASGGKNIMSNLITICNICHSRKLGKVNKRGAAGLRSLSRSASESSSSSWGKSWKDYE